MSQRKKSIFPFAVLSVIHLILLVMTFVKNKNRSNLWALLFSNMGFAYLFEFLVLNVWQAYRYKPKVFKRSYFNNIFGAILSQAVFIPFTAVFISGLRLRWKWKLFFIAYFHVVERLFIKMDIYRTYWWKPIFTTLALPVYFFLSDKWYELLKEKVKKVQFLSLWLANVVIKSNILFILAVCRQVRFGRGKCHTVKEHFIYAPLYTVANACITTWFLWKGEGYKGWVKSFVAAAGFDWFLYQKKIVKIDFFMAGLNLFLHGLTCLMMMGFKRISIREREK